jgi:hypothetical protein
MKHFGRFSLTLIGVLIGAPLGCALGFFVPFLIGSAITRLGDGSDSGYWIFLFLTVPGGLIAGAVCGGYLGNRLASRCDEDPEPVLEERDVDAIMRQKLGPPGGPKGPDRF